MKAKISVIIIIVLIGASVVFFMFQGGGKKSSEILVLSGGTFRTTMEEIIQNYGKISNDKVLLTAGESGELCSQIKYTKKGDIYVSHDPFMPWAEKQGLIAGWRTVGYLEPVIAVKKGNPKNIKEFKDLAGQGLRIGITDPYYSTCGVIIEHALRKLDYEKAFRKNIKATTRTHAQLATDLTLGPMDAVVIWNAVANNYKDKIDVIPVNKNFYVDAITSATYGVTDVKNIKATIGIITYAKDKKNVRKFWEYATTEGKEVFKKYGFAPAEE